MLILLDLKKVELKFLLMIILDKNFVKDLSIKIFEWTDQRWIITFSKKR